jgi:hypothetical protein
VTCLPALLAPIAITASLLAGCSDGYIMTAGEADPAPVKTEDRTAVPVAKATIGERLASARLDDGRLGEVRGGLDAGSGMVLSFSFQEATYVNHSLAQTIVVPTVTIVPGTSMMAVTNGLGNNTTIPIAAHQQQHGADTGKFPGSRDALASEWRDDADRQCPRRWRADKRHQ